VYFCGAERVLRMQFNVDGMGGAFYEAKS